MFARTSKKEGHTCRDRPKLKTKSLLSFGKNVIFFHDVYSYMPKLEACANKTYTGVSTTSTCRDRSKMKTKLLLSFGKNEFSFMMFILICQNSKHVQKKTYTGV